MDIKYPDITVQLSNESGNGFYIVARVMEALEGARVPQETIEEYQQEALSGDYGHLLQTTMKWVKVS
jgi:hypothetical protein